MQQDTDWQQKNKTELEAWFLSAAEQTDPPAAELLAVRGQLPADGHARSPRVRRHEAMRHPRIHPSTSVH